MAFIRKYAYHIGIGLLVLTAFFLRLSISGAELFLHDWDERFHALVARNMMDHPFTPMLIKQPFAPYDPNLWCCNHIWIHKQPLFLWQMAFSMKIFGVNELALRLPSILTGSLAVLLTARIAFLLTGNRIISFYSALLLCFSNFHIELISGIEGMDHNDVALGFYVLASVWAYTEYYQSRKWYWLLFIGIFAGAAVLNKWLVGLFVFLVWGVQLLMEWYNTKRFEIRTLKHFFISLFVCGLVFIPWQLYILNLWPDLARHEYEYNRRHITEALDGHEGNAWYYLNYSRDFFGRFLGIFVIIGAVLGFRKHYVNPSLYPSLFAGLFFVFCFFSFIVKTKVQSHFFFIVPLCMILISLSFYEIVMKYRRWYLYLGTSILFIFLSFKPRKLYQYFYPENIQRENKLSNTFVFKNLHKELPGDVKLVMNMGPYENIELMFFQNNLTAYDYPLSEELLTELGKKHVPIAVFQYPGRQLPDYVTSYPYLYRIKSGLK